MNRPEIPEHPAALTIEGQRFEHVQNRVYEPVSVYRGNENFLRVGPNESIAQEREKHEQLYELGFPVAELLGHGQYTGERAYYIERSLGSESYADVFTADCRLQGEVSTEHFDAFCAVMQRYATAQVRTLEQGNSFEVFAHMTHADIIADDFPNLRDIIKRTLAKLEGRLTSVPSTLVHDDLNPMNVLEGGVIDVAGMRRSAGAYDLEAAIYHIAMFPSDEGYEDRRRFDYSADQRRQYLALVDQVYAAGSDFKPSAHIPEYIVGKLFWAAARMQDKPQVLAWRGALLERVLTAYLTEGDVPAELLKPVDSLF